MAREPITVELGHGEQQPKIGPCALIIFGGTGDLSHRKLLPALYSLAVDGRLPEQFAILGSSSQKLTDDTYRDFARSGVEEFSREPFRQDHWQRFAPLLHFSYCSLERSSDYGKLRARLEELERRLGTKGNRLFYFAIPPALIQGCAAHLTASGLVAPAKRDSFVRVVIEKPIGNDLKSARQINVQLAEHFAESQIFRIDHYLGKETVENLMVLRFANAVFEPLWNARFIDHVQITVAEEEGVGRRGSYYEEAGALRDMVQSHLLQVLCMVAMEPPRSLEADAVRDAKLDVLRELRPFEREEIANWVVRGQYGDGVIGRETAPAYGAEKGVAPDSKIETYVALRCFVENWRWAGVPFYLKTGKRLPKRVSEIAICFKAVPRILFNRSVTPLETNLLAICIQPGEGLSLNIISKVPGPPLRLNPVKVDFHYRTAAPEAYETLLRDVMSGDQTLFMRRDHVEQAWRFIQPILDESTLSGAQPFGYPAGSWGPVEAAMMIAADGRAWRKL